MNNNWGHKWSNKLLNTTHPTLLNSHQYILAPLPSRIYWRDHQRVVKGSSALSPVKTEATSQPIRQDTQHNSKVLNSHSLLLLLLLPAYSVQRGRQRHYPLPVKTLWWHFPPGTVYITLRDAPPPLRLSVTNCFASCWVCLGWRQVEFAQPYFWGDWTDLPA